MSYSYDTLLEMANSHVEKEEVPALIAAAAPSNPLWKTVDTFIDGEKSRVRVAARLATNPAVEPEQVKELFQWLSESEQNAAIAARTKRVALYNKKYGTTLSV